VTLQVIVQHRAATEAGLGVVVGITISLAVTCAAAAVWMKVERWAVMLLLAAAVYFSLKVLTLRQALSRGAQYDAAGAMLYVFAWIGLDGQAFVRQRSVQSTPAAAWIACALKIALGITMVWAVAPLLLGTRAVMGGWIGWIGLGFVLHLGCFHAMALAWQGAGRDVRPIMEAPIAARSVAEFWGRRWNRAFHDAVMAGLFNPCARRVGSDAALFITFLISGLIHDLMISIPAGGGYGLPTLYFLVQWLGIVIERSRVGRRLGLRAGARGWLFTAAVTAGPAPILFHPPFILRVVVPFLGAIGAG
jgi:hypothetical protein